MDYLNKILEWILWIPIFLINLIKKIMYLKQPSQSKIQNKIFKFYTRSQIYQYDDPKMTINKHRFFDINKFIFNRSDQPFVKQKQQNTKSKCVPILQEIKLQPQTHELLKEKLLKFVELSKKKSSSNKKKTSDKNVFQNSRLEELFKEGLDLQINNVKDQMILDILHTFLSMKNSSFEISQENNNRVLRLCLQIKNLEWSAYVLHELFLHKQTASFELLDEFIILNKQKLSDNRVATEPKFMASIFDDKLISLGYQELLPTEKQSQFNQIEEIWKSQRNINTNKQKGLTSYDFQKDIFDIY